MQLPEGASVPYPIVLFIKGALVLSTLALFVGVSSYIMETYTQLLKDLFVGCVVVVVTLFVGWLVDTA